MPATTTESTFTRRMRLLQRTVDERVALQHAIANRMAAGLLYGDLIDRNNVVARRASFLRLK